MSFIDFFVCNFVGIKCVDTPKLYTNNSMDYYCKINRTSNKTANLL